MKLSKVNRDTILLLSSSILSILIVLAAYEVFEHIRYHRWRSFYRNNGDLYGNLTVRSSNRELIWEYRPYGECRSKTQEYKGRSVGIIKTNRYGFRDRDYESTEKPDGTYRIAFIGDSITLGLWVNFDEMFTRRFEVEANRLGLGRRLQALNFGVDGYHTVQICEMLKTKVLSFSPDKVVYVMCLNDFDFEEAAAYKVHYFRKPKSFLLWRLRRAYNLYGRSEGIDYHVYHLRKKKDVVFPSILEMSNVLKQQDIGFQVVILPIFDLNAAGFDTYSLSEMHDEIEGFLAENGIDVFDLLEAFKRQGEPPRYFAYDVWHPNEEGHRFIAHTLLQPVLSEYDL